MTDDKTILAAQYMAMRYPIEGDRWMKRARTVPSIKKEIFRTIFEADSENIVYDCIVKLNDKLITSRREAVTRKVFQRWAQLATYLGPAEEQ